MALRCLVEGMGVRPTARLVGCHHQTILKLLVAAGTWSARFCDETLRELPCRRIELDEMWSYVYTKQKNVSRAKSPPYTAGDAWVWVAFCRDTKLVPSWRIGDRTAVTGIWFLKDLVSRLSHRVQLTSDGHRAYLEAVEEAFGDEVDFAQLVKVCSPEELSCTADIISGQPDLDAISTSGVERQNLTLRMSQRRFTRRTNGFSKKIINHAHAVALHYLYYNFCRVHQSLDITPAMAAGVTQHRYNIGWIVEQVARQRPKPNRPKTYRKISK